MRPVPDDGPPSGPGSLGWLAGLLIAGGAVVVTVGTVLGTPMGGEVVMPDPTPVRTMHPLPGGRGDAPPHLRPLAIPPPAATVEPSGPLSTEHVPQLP